MTQDVWLTGDATGQGRITIPLASGRRVWVLRFGYSGTYDGLLEGAPSAELNANIIASRGKAAKLRAWDVVLTLPPPTRTDERGRPHLPPVCCVAELESLPMNETMHISALTVVWFAVPFFSEPLADFLNTSLSSLPWEQHAKDCDL